MENMGFTRFEYNAGAGAGVLGAGEEEDESMERAAATKVQAAFRGYSVRRRKPLSHLRTIAGVKRKLNELQVKATDPSYVENLCVDIVECRRFTEGIMALLLQLDALQGVHPVVRDIRKSVNREVAQFMEVIDAVVVGAAPSPWQDARNAPNIVRSSSISHLDRSSSYSLKRTLSLDSQGYEVDSEKLNQGTENALRAYEDSHAFVRAIPIHGTADFESETDRNLAGESSYGKGSGVSDPDLLLRWSAAALFVQSRFRGYQVRRSRPLKHLRNIADVKWKLRELSVQLADPGFLLIFRSDDMERLKLTERITALLLQLDSVQGVDQVVRDIRKSVTREVFKLQESVDALIHEACSIRDSGSAARGNRDTLQEERRLTDRDGEVSAATVLSQERNESLDVEGNNLEDRISAIDVPSSRGVPEQPPEVQSLNALDRAIEAGESSFGSRVYESNMVELGDAAECKSPARELHDAQVRGLELRMQNNATSCASTESAEEIKINDLQSLLCAAAVGSEKKCPCRVYDEQDRTMPAVSFASSPRETICTESSKSRVGGTLNGAPALPDEACLEETWTASSVVGRSGDIQYSNPGATAPPNRSISCAQEFETSRVSKSLDVTPLAGALERFKVQSDDARAADIVESDVLSQTYGTKNPGECIDFGGGSPAHSAEDPISFGTLYKRKCSPPPPTSTVTEDTGYEEDIETTASEFEYGSESSYVLIEPDFQHSTSDENVSEQSEPCQLLTEQRTVDRSVTTDLSSLDITSGSHETTTTGEDTNHQEFEKMDVVSHLVNENKKLRSLLNEVLIFAEMLDVEMTQCKKLEVEITQVKRQEDNWPKKPKSVRRRK